MRDAPLIESRWLTLRVLGIAISAGFAWWLVPTTLATWRPLLAALVAIVVYGVPAEIFLLMAQRRAERSAPWFLSLLRPFELIVAPIADPMVWLARLVARRVPSEPAPPDAKVTETEMELLVSEGELNGSLAQDQSEMIRNVLDFGGLTAGQLMVPRTQVTALDITTPPVDLLRIVAEHGHSRYPVYRDNVDNVIGLLHVKDLVALAAERDLKELDVEEVLRKPVVFVPEKQSASSVLGDMRAGRHHMAVVIDEFGGMSGVITLEDVIEEIVGDIRDEHDDAEAPPIIDLGDGRLMVDASFPLSDLGRYLGTELPETGDYHSLGGFIIDRLGEVPSAGAKIVEQGMEFIVRDADERHVEKVEIVRKTPSPDSMAPRSSQRTAAA